MRFILRQQMLAFKFCVLLLMFFGFCGSVYAVAPVAGATVDSKSMAGLSKPVIPAPLGKVNQQPDAVAKKYITSSKQPLPDNIRFLLAHADSGIKVYLVDGVLHPFYQIRMPAGSGKAPIPNVFVKKDKLHIISSAYLPVTTKAVPQIIIAVRQLKGLSILGDVTLQASNLGKELTALYVNSPWTVNLYGDVAPGYIVDRGHGLLTLRWLNVGELNLSALGNSRIELNGKADFLRASVSDHGFLDGRYLQVKDCYVHSTDHSLVTLHVSDTLHGFAYNHSQVLYYSKPRHISRVTRNSGNILQMISA